MELGIAQHEVCVELADFFAVSHQLDMFRPHVFAAHLVTVGHSLRTTARAVQAQADTLIELPGHTCTGCLMFSGAFLV